MVEAFAPAKINLTLHVTGQRADGFHTLDSLVMFADIGDRLNVSLSDRSAISVCGPMANGVPDDDSNLCLRVAGLMGQCASVRLEKNLPNAAGLGGGSSDAAAMLKALSKLTSAPLPDDDAILGTGADILLCLQDSASRMRGIGEIITPLPGLPRLHAVLVNPNLPVPTPEVFRRLKQRVNPSMPTPLPDLHTASDLIAFLRGHAE